MKQLIAIVVFGSILIVAVILGCNPKSTNIELERERIARQEAEHRAQLEQERREQDQQTHDAEKSRLWAYVFGVALMAVVLLFIGTGLGSAARKDAERTKRNYDTNPTDLE